MRSLFLAVLLLAAPIHAQPTAEALQAARDVVEALSTEPRQQATVQDIRAYLIQSVQRAAVNVAPSTVTEIVDTVLLPDVVAQFGEVNDAAAVIWATHYSVEDMRVIRDFVSSPAGRRFRDLIPVVNAEIGEFSVIWRARASAAAATAHRDLLIARGITP